MDTGSPSSKPKGASSPDRYVSFLDIDFEGNVAADVFATCAGTSTTPRKEMSSRTGSSNACSNARLANPMLADKLLLLHSHVYYMVELF